MSFCYRLKVFQIPPHRQYFFVSGHCRATLQTPIDRQKIETLIKFAYTILYVKDVEKSIDFYEKAFGFSRKFVTPENDYGELLVGETTLSFCSLTLANSNFKDGFIERILSTIEFSAQTIKSYKSILEKIFASEDVERKNTMTRLETEIKKLQTQKHLRVI